ncbi:MAG: Ribosomal RNA large subunit methyltransferase J [Paracidovorax wautersii]|uniref:Ribosomal RNA large subunit methyltransferase J n=1 Tax=Paracidovorax wautersii TaxID=1177982 RepID=A0A7V8FRB1_9BURK|nr:MAG: Ribosomal RNA large subunit methyltransferase J [Paracidovorax wautersii]
MFSYRHAFHAGNHADVLKHTVLIAMLQHLTQKEAALTVIDTHAGAGLYRLDNDAAQTSGEAEEGIFELLRRMETMEEDLAPALNDYVELVASFNPSGVLKNYPGSPFITHKLLREHDRLKLFELYPGDARSLRLNVDQLDAGRQVQHAMEDGFESSRKYLPPPSRRGLVLIDPSYELKSDYGRVTAYVAEMLKLFATGTFAVWYPIIPRPEAHDLPRKLKNLAVRAGKPWLNASLAIKSGKPAPGQRSGLAESGICIINPPHTLRPALQQALPQMVALMGQDKQAGFELKSGG